ncbi:MAG: smr domain-containing protein [Alphaproteobacteria bacterium]|nr:MAG: smr domain-containing protein [Alphaproteobacteria bacterium]
MSNKGRNLNDGELSLWRKFVQGVSAWKDTESETQEFQSSQAKPTSIKNTRSKPAKALPARSKPSSSIAPSVKTLDRRTDEKLSKGKMPIEATLDLHGMTQAQAHNTLERFLVGAHQSGKRCVLVITGKGSGKIHDDHIVSERREKGVLRSRLPDWLAMSPLNAIVLKHVSATQKHGGGGAFYIYLKNNRK